MDKSLNRGMFNKFESRKICVGGYQCDNSDFDFCNAEHNELPVIKIYSDEGRDDCQQLKPKGTEASFVTTVITVTILFLFQFCLAEHFCLACCVFSSNCVYCDAVHGDFALSASFVLECFDGSEVMTNYCNSVSFLPDNSKISS